jgi:hypothetical protein
MARQGDQDSYFVWLNCILDVKAMIFLEIQILNRTSLTSWSSPLTTPVDLSNNTYQLSRVRPCTCANFLESDDLDRQGRTSLTMDWSVIRVGHTGLTKSDNNADQCGLFTTRIQFFKDRFSRFFMSTTRPRNLCPINIEGPRNSCHINIEGHDWLSVWSHQKHFIPLVFIFKP